MTRNTFAAAAVFLLAGSLVLTQVSPAGAQWLQNAVGVLVSAATTCNPNIGTCLELDNPSGVSKFSVSNQGNVVVAGQILGSSDIQAGQGAAIYWRLRAELVSPADAVVQQQANAGGGAQITYSGLPPCTAALEGSAATITDDNSATYRTAAAGGGTNHVYVRCLGSSWLNQ